MPAHNSDSDPDRFFDFATPGAQEWWYFDALSEDGRDALVIIWYCGLPFDPDYGRSTFRHLRDPARHPSPRAVDHAAIGLSWYRDGKTVAYALNAHPAEAFAHQPKPFSVAVGASRVEREISGYALKVETPAVDGRHQVAAELRFLPARATLPVERNLGMPEAPHHWILAAPDCQVRGVVALEGPRPRRLDFQGRGYHDHNAGSAEISLAMRSWTWGRVHHGPLTEVFYQAIPQVGPPSSLWFTSRDGAPERMRDGVAVGGSSPRLGAFGIRSRRLTVLEAGPGERLECQNGPCVDDGPFYRRWVSTFRRSGEDPEGYLGISEHLEPKHLHHPLVRWMIPYRLKRPRDSRGSVAGSPPISTSRVG